MKLRPIVDQTNTCYYNAGKVLASNLQPLADNKYTLKNFQLFPDILSNIPHRSPDEEDVSYGVESLFTNLPIDKTIDYICKQIYDKKLTPMCSKAIFVKLLKKVITECIFSANGRLYKQTDGAAMGGPLSVVFSDCFLNEMEEQLVAPASPIFYIRYVDDTFVRKKRNVEDKLFKALDAFHSNIKLTIEENSSNFLDTLFPSNKDGFYSFQVVNKSSKLSFHFLSQVQYKRSVVMGELHRAKAIGSDFDFEMKRIKS